MSSKIKLYNCCVLCAYLSSICSYSQAQSSRDSKLKMQNFIRCTRRYTPGICLEPIKSVWTFVFQLQNCTERYGCPTELRSNRFSSYSRCLRRCKPLMNLYTEILAHDTQNLSVYLRSKSWVNSGRRDIDTEDDFEFDEETSKPDQGVEGPAPNPLEDDSDYKYRQFTPDIDYIDEETKQDDLMEHLRNLEISSS